jgi:hypothetical protein
MNEILVIIILASLIGTVILASYSSGVLGVSEVHSPEFQFERNYANSSSSDQTGMNRT